MSCYWIILSTKLPLVPLTVAVIVANPVPPSSVPMTGLVVVVDGMVILVEGLALHVASVVRSVPFSSNAVKVSVVPVAKVIVSPDVHDVQLTVTALDVLVHEIPTQTVAVLLTAPIEDTLVAVIVTVLERLVTDSAFTNPLFTLAIFGSELLQVVPDSAVMFRVVPSLYVPVAVSCWALPASVRLKLEGVIITLLKLGSTNQSQAVPNTSRRAPRIPRTLN
jgi:hypothetical protein